MNINEIEDILGVSRLPKPQHIFIVNETVWEQVNGQVIYRGLQPKEKKSIVVLTPDTIDETPAHEIGHTLGLREMGATVLGKISAMKYHVLCCFPSVKALVEKSVEYEKCSGCSEFAKAHTYGDRVEHFRLKR